MLEIARDLPVTVVDKGQLESFVAENLVAER